jgi:hypothetical protein
MSLRLGTVVFGTCRVIKKYAKVLLIHQMLLISVIKKTSRTSEPIRQKQQPPMALLTG